ncbi:LysR family transcriptional regulator [Nocardia sp. NPDC024068]|uniref:LysR family transcriptional regulator n=1 Tax=Nocardia sp. NPDC024068 TaxID=3157197 RepID=UPI003403DEA1
MDTRILRSFLAVARTGSFTTAALDLGYTQSTVTGHIHRLEQQLGRRLLDRLPSGAVVTDIGARLIEHAEDILDAEHRLHDATRGSTRPTGTVRIVAPESLCTYRLPAIISALRIREPGIQIWVGPAGLGEATEAVRRGSAELGLIMEPRAPVTELGAERIGAEPLLLLDHPDRSGTPATWDDLAARDALLIEEGCGYSDEVAARLAATGVRPGRRSRFGSVEAIKRCVVSELGWTALPTVTVESEIRAGVLGVLRGPELPPCEIRVLTHPRRLPGPATLAVLARLRTHWSP